PPLTIAGVVRDSSSGRTIERAEVAINGTSIVATSDGRGRFELRGVLPGAYTLVTTTPSLDSVASVQLTPAEVIDGSKQLEVRTASASQVAARICAGTRAPAGMIVGTVSVRSDSTRPANVRLVADWGDASRALRTRTDSLGRFRFCDVPVNTSVSVRAESSPSAGVVQTRVPDGGRVAKADLILANLPPVGAVFAGVVATDSTKEPIEGAEVVFPELGRGTQTDRRGAFRLEGLAPGNHQLVVRRIGYGPVDTRIDLTSDQPIERNVFLARSVTLDSVKVVATASERLRWTFDDHRRLGLGSFFTKEDLEKTGLLHIADVLQMTRGAAILRGNGSQAWLVPQRGVSSKAIRPDSADLRMGAKDWRCYSNVWLNGVKVYGGRDQEPLFNLNSIGVEQIDAMEYYAGPSSTPPRYSDLDATCGTVVIWTRR
ncbi:MAG TPA: carboxypeptidase regulatory-like domain-containing protein, partial [Gemmatimonadaceae bacterium]